MLPIDLDQLAALVVDLDGTLYRQRPVQRAMLWRLLRAHVGRLQQGLLTIRVLRAYRKAQEDLRASALQHRDLADAQVQLAAQWAGTDAGVVRACVTRWMEEAPLDLVARSMYEGLPQFLHAATTSGLRLGVLSDYPATAKLQRMNLLHFFEVVVSAQDPEVQRFKPHPRGLEVTLRRLGVEKHQALYIGDRPEVDAVAASNAGMACVIMGRQRGARGPREWGEVTTYRELHGAIFGLPPHHPCRPT